MISLVISMVYMYFLASITIESLDLPTTRSDMPKAVQRRHRVYFEDIYLLTVRQLRKHFCFLFVAALSPCSHISFNHRDQGASLVSTRFQQVEEVRPRIK